MTKEYKTLSATYIEQLVDELNKGGSEGWEIVAYLQECMVTKLLLQREIPAQIKE